ncbi:MAG: beta-lactamase family protein [Chloroflexi bacterium]|nr:beta-lactamase family protein [Chloroflexota bacterium]
MSNTLSSKSWLSPARIIFAVLSVSLVAAGVFTFWPRASAPTRDYWPTNGWETASPESRGFDSAKLAIAINTMKTNGTAIHSLTIVRHGTIFLDAYFYPYDGTTLHDVASVTKSITTTLIGIAADKGLLDLDAPMISFFPERTIANLDEWKKQITVRHLVTMSSGLDCYRTSEGEPTLQQMKASDDWVQFTLDLKPIHQPGTVWDYCSPGSHMLSAILTQATGMSTLEFAQENLFDPLGIEEVYWPADATGFNHGWGDLAMYPRDMAKVGYLWLNNGMWEGQQIISRKWVENAVKPRLVADNGEAYGYGWWVNLDEIFAYMASGRGGQEIQVVPAFDVVIVKTGAGFDPSQVDQFIEASVGDVESGAPALPENVEGQALLQEAIAGVAQAPETEPVPPLPDIAREISGKRFVGEPNTLLEYIALTFDEPNQMQFELKVAYEPEPRLDMAGLDGLYRDSVNGRIVKARAEWVDEQTFIIEYNEGPGLDLMFLWMRFEEDQVRLEIAGQNWVGTMEQ